MNQVHADLRVSAARAEASRLAMSRLMAVAGHDLKQPLQVAVMSIVRAAGEPVQSRAAARLRIALDALTRLGSELDDLARSSLSEAGMQPVIRPVQVGSVMAAVERDWRVYAEECGVELRFRCPSITVDTDEAMLRTMLRNLVGNAVKFCSRGGRVVVGCRRRGGSVLLQIHDNGYGISASRLASIFDAFERGDWEGRGEGLGLGLHIVRQTANALGHPISVRSIDGEGSTFSVTLPRANTTSATGATGRAHAAPHVRMTVMASDEPHPQLVG